MILKDFQRNQFQFQGFFKTPILWKSKIFGLKQLQLPVLSCPKFNMDLPPKLRLGKRVERFVSCELNHINNIDIVLENIQIQQDKLTLGELDCIFIWNKRPIHLEVVYKFYLYDTSVGVTEIEHCIGPNRKDSLVKKLTKLKEKQCPLLYAPETKAVLHSVNLDAKNIEQLVYFKAQVFMPYKDKNIAFKELNPDCINGYYITYQDLVDFQTCKFYLPSKADWLLEAHSQVSWLHIEDFKNQASSLLQDKIAPLIWIKKPKGEINKCFLVWW